uniref:Uncharacterized protein n=1 Tax=Globisporangium ultimum (strain ATCC 200006 / CBS 805.95 / DAOM BR144) TaxID=431595 RepID=K3WG97_GLOUD
MTTYCGSIGSVNVLEFMSTDLFDESQENPFLLRRHNTHDAPLYCSPAGSPISKQASVSWTQPQHSLRLPLEDPHGPLPYMGSPIKQSLYGAPASPFKPTVMTPEPQQQVPASPPRASVTFNLPKSILKRQSSYESSNASTTAASDTAAVDVSETELHKLLYSLARFSVASEASAASSAPSQPQPQQHYQPRQYSMSQPASPSPYNSSSQWSYEEDQGRTHEFNAQDRRRSSSPSKKKKPQRSQSADRGYETDPGTMTSDDEDYGYSDGERSPGGRAMRARASVTFETVKNLLRGGGGVNRTSRIVKRSIPDLHHKCTGTVSSRLKRRQKFERPTILTDAYHRVSTMRLGTKPMPTKIKHLAFPGIDAHDPRYYEQEADPGMPSPKGQLRHNSLILLETLDKIGTRASCPVHLIDEGAPDYSNVRARVDSYNHAMRPKQGLRRPSAWLMGGATSPPKSSYYGQQRYDSD